MFYIWVLTTSMWSFFFCFQFVHWKNLSGELLPYFAQMNHYIHEACDFKLIQASTEETKRWWQSNTSDLGSPNFCHYTFFFYCNSCQASLFIGWKVKWLQSAIMIGEATNIKVEYWKKGQHDGIRKRLLVYFTSYVFIFTYHQPCKSPWFFPSRSVCYSPRNKNVQNFDPSL